MATTNNSGQHPQVKSKSANCIFNYKKLCASLLVAVVIFGFQTTCLGQIYDSISPSGFTSFGGYINATGTQQLNVSWSMNPFSISSSVVSGVSITEGIQQPEIDVPIISGISTLKAPIGSLVTITGKRFLANSVVKIGSINQEVVSVSATKLVIMVMPGTVSGVVSVVNGGNQVSSSSYVVSTTLYPLLQQGSKIVDATTPNTTNNYDLGQQGYSVSISADGNTAIVGGIGAYNNVGQVWIYTRSGNIWSLQTTIQYPRGTNTTPPGFGSSVAISADGNKVLIGSPYDSTNNFGGAFLYSRSGTSWSYTTRLLPLDGIGTSINFGAAVSISADGSTALVAANNDNNGTGAGWIFSNLNGVWYQTSKLTGTGATTSTSLGYSAALSADGNTAILGGYYDNNGQGAAWVFKNNGTWIAGGTKITDATSNNSNQGSSVAINADGTTALLGGPLDSSQVGATWVYTYSGSAWTKQAKLVGSDGFGIQQQGYSAALSGDGNTAFIGGYFDSSGVGATWSFTRIGTTWYQAGKKLVGTGKNGLAYMGNSLALSADGTTAFVGGNNDSLQKGASWVFISTPIPIITSFTPTSGVTGTQVTISGYNLAYNPMGKSTVTIGGVAATVVDSTQSGSITTLKVNVGVGASGSIQVTNSGYSDSKSGFTYLNCLPSNKSLDTTVCANKIPFTWNGVSVTGAGTYVATLAGRAKSGCDSIITGNFTIDTVPVPKVAGNNAACKTTTLTASNGATYKWKIGNTTMGTSNAQVFDSTGLYTIIVTNAKGCYDSLMQNVVINQNPIPLVTGEDTACNQVVLVASGGNTYSWSTGKNLTAAKDTFITSGAYNATLRVTNSSTSCYTDTIIHIKVNIKPTVSITSSTTGCDSITLTGVGSNTASPYIYSWNYGQRDSSAVTKIYGNGTDTTITNQLTITDGNGCVDSTFKTVTVYAHPSIVISGNDTACTSVSLTAAKAAASSTISSYTWKLGSSTVSTSSSITTTTSGRYGVRYTDSRGCAATDSVYIKVNPLPTITSITQVSNGCGSVILTANVTTDGEKDSLATFNWNGAGSDPASVSNAFTSNGTYNVTVTNPSTLCAATAAATISTIGVNHTVTLNQTGTNTCLGNAILNSSVNTPSTAQQIIVFLDSIYTKTVNGVSSLMDTIVGAHLDTIKAGNSSVIVTPFTPTNGGKYFALAKFSDGCIAQSSFTTVNTANISIVGPAKGCQTVTLSGSGGKSYSWNGGTTPSGNSNTYNTVGTQNAIVLGIDSNSCVGTDTLAITIVNTPPPSASLTGSSVGCDSVVLTASGGGSYTWNGGKTPTNSINTFYHSGIDSVLITDNVSGCSIYLTKNVLINPSPTVYIPGYQSECGKIILTATGASTYQWNSGTTPNSAENNFTQGGTNYLTLKGTDANGCSTTVYDTISVKAAPALVLSGNTISCDSVSITASGGNNYSWSGGTHTSSATNVFYDPTPTTYSVTAYNANGCTATQSVTVSAYSFTPSVSIVSTDTVFCSSKTVTFTATPTLGGTSPKYQWYKNRVAISSATASTYAYLPTNLDTITCRLVSNNTCLVNDTIWSGDIVEKLSTPLTPSITVAASSLNVCAGTNVTFTATPTNSGSNPTYQWKVNNGTITSATATTYSYTPSNGDVVLCAYTSKNACTTPTVTSSVTMVVNANVLPSIVIATSNNSVCTGTNVTFTATPTNGGSNPAYKWMKNGVEISGATTATYASSTLVNNDAISCLLTANNTCQTNATAISNSIVESITQNVDPIATISASITGTICVGRSVTYTANLFGGTTSSYQWYNKRNPVSGATGATLSNTASDNDSIYCLVTGINACQITKGVNSNAILVTSNVTPSVVIAATPATIYKGTSVTITATSTNSGSAPSYNFKVNGASVQNGSSNTYTTTAFVNNDAVSCTVTTNNTCQTVSTASANLTITVTKFTPTVNTIPTASTITYGQTLANSILSGGTASVAGTFTFTTSSTAPNAGTSSQGFTFTPTNTTDYLTVTGNVNVTVNKAASSITATGATSYTYNGNVQGPETSTESGSAGTITYSYSGTGSTVYTASATKPTAAGTYQVIATVATDANYNATSSTALAFSINKAASSITATGTTSFTYSASVQGPETSTALGSTGPITYSYAGTGSTVYAANATKPTNAGTYQVIASVAADANYNAASSTALAFTIGQASSSITATGTTSFTYTATAQGPATNTKSGSTGSITYSYSGTGSTTYIASATKPTAAGTYQVIATVAADANFTGANSIALAFTIAQASSSITATGSVTYTYTANPQGPATNSRTGSTGAVSYSYSGTGATSYTASATKPTAAGTYQVIATVAADANFTGATSIALDFTITKATPTITTLPTASSIVYGQTLSSSSLNNGSASIAGTFAFTTNATAPNAGTASQGFTFTPSDVSNYNTITGSVGVLVNKAILTVTATAQTVSFATAQSAVIANGAYTVAGFVNNETAQVMSGVVTYSTTYLSTSTVGLVGVTIAPIVSGLSAANYSFNAVSGVITVVPAVPGAPVAIIPTADNAQAVIGYTAPVSNGGATIIDYTITAIPASGTNIVRTGIIDNPYTFTGLTNGTAYTFTIAARNSAGTGSTITSIAITPSKTTTWNGTTWSAGLPDSTQIAVISGNLTNNTPIVCSKLIVNTGVTFTNNSTLTVTNSPDSINGTIKGTGTIVLAGTSAQTIAGTGSVGNITLNNPSGATITGSLGVTGALNLQSGTLNTNGNVTLQSTSIANSGVLGPVGVGGNSGTINGSITVERYIPKGFRAYRDMSANGVYNPANTMFSTWQEGGSYTHNGYGMFITGTPNATVNQNSIDANTGIDYSLTGYASAYYYKSGWNTITNTKTTALNPFQSFRVLIRGDRSFDLYTTPVVMVTGPTVLAMQNATTLRASGIPIIGTVTFRTTGVTNAVSGATYNNSLYGLNSDLNGYSYLANPYACPIVFDSVYNNSSNIKSSYYYLDPTIGSTGAWVSYNALSHVSSKAGMNNGQYIQAGQGFLVGNNNSTAPVVVLNEAYKATSPDAKTAVFGSNNPNSTIGLSLWFKYDSTYYNAGGNATIAFDSSYNNAMWGGDNTQFMNTNDNLSVVSTDGVQLAIYAKKTATAHDTIPIVLGQLSTTNYQLQIDASSYFGNGLTPYIYDKYLNTNIELKITLNNVPFKADNAKPATYQNRFSIIFKSATLPIKQMNASAMLRNGKAIVAWTTIGEVNVKAYQVEKSTDSKNFSPIGEVAATNALDYNFSDNNLSSNSNYYRIKATSTDGNIVYSNVVKIINILQLTTYNLYPNPLTGKTLNVQLGNVVAGNYEVSIINSLGQKVAQQTIKHTGENETYQVNVKQAIATGVYNVVIKEVNTKEQVFHSTLSIQ